jgi:iron-sulfur cluster assembly protein
MTANIRPITISHRACQEIHRIRQTKGIPPDYGLRVGVRGGGCGGVSLMIGFDKQKETDLSWTVDGLSVYVEKKHAMYLFGKQVDFVDDAEGRGFAFVNDPGTSS